MVIKRFGDQALLIEFEQLIEKEVLAKVLACKNWLETQLREGITFITPAYCSLCVGFDIKLWNYDSLKQRIEKSADLFALEEESTTRLVRVPVCYEMGLDKAEVETQLAIDWATFVEKHTSKTYEVFMLGFLPGFPYMGKLDQSLQCTRKPNPRKQVPERTLAIAGLQTGIYPISAPGGWQLIGRTPIPLVQVSSNQSFLFQVGDQVQFDPISEEEFERLEIAFQNGQLKWEDCYE